MKKLMLIVGSLSVMAGIAGAACALMRQRGAKQWSDMRPRPVNHMTPAEGAIDQQIGDYYGSSRQQPGQRYAHFAQN